MAPKRFTANNSIYDVIFVRSSWVSDGAITDDEFTPHIFQDGNLVAIGWNAIGGEKWTSKDVARAKMKEFNKKWKSELFDEQMKKLPAF